MKKLISIVVTMGCLAVVSEALAAKEALPAGLHGFSGQVRGVVVTAARENTFTFKVMRVLRTWENNRAERPELLVSRTVPVGPRWVKGENGKWHPVERQVAFIRSLRAGEEMNLEVQQVEREHFHILELSEEQRERKQQGEKRESVVRRQETERVIKLEAEIKRLNRELEELREELRKRK
jgi:hypothetical protein